MDILRQMNWYELKHEYELDGKRLLPWVGWNMPFGSAWCVVRAYSKSLRHNHSEQEMFVGVSGQARVHVGDRSYEIRKGDIIAIPPGDEHFVENNTETDFHFFALWWSSETVGAFLEGEREHDHG